MGFVSANEKHWKTLYQANTNLGICVTPDDAYQILRGMRSMGIRLAHHQKSALDIATAGKPRRRRERSASGAAELCRA